MADMKIVREWLSLADEDFDFASVNLEENDKFFGKICFHYQQAGEKYLKAYIVAFNLEFKKIHNLRTLMEICQEKDSAFAELKEECITLNTFYIDTRYPAIWPVGLTRNDAQQAKESAEIIGDFVKKKLTI